MYFNVSPQKWFILTFFRKNGMVLHIYSLKQLHLSLENVPVEPRSAAVEQVAAPVEPVLAPVDKGSSPLRFQRPYLSAGPGALPFLIAALPRNYILKGGYRK